MHTRTQCAPTSKRRNTVASRGSGGRGRNILRLGATAAMAVSSLPASYAFGAAAAAAAAAGGAGGAACVTGRAAASANLSRFSRLAHRTAVLDCSGPAKGGSSSSASDRARRAAFGFAPSISTTASTAAAGGVAAKMSLGRHRARYTSASPIPVSWLPLSGMSRERDSAPGVVQLATASQSRGGYHNDRELHAGAGHRSRALFSAASDAPPSPPTATVPAEADSGSPPQAAAVGQEKAAEGKKKGGGKGKKGAGGGGGGKKKKGAVADDTPVAELRAVRWRACLASAGLSV